jgi:hypothetical protein
MRFTRTERLPSTVLQARERVSERLRGVSLVGGRYVYIETKSAEYVLFLFNSCT